MKRVLPILILLLLSGAVFGDTVLSVGPGFQFSSQLYRFVDRTDTLTAAMLGLHVGGFYGGVFGLCTQLQFCFFPLDLTLAGVGLDPDAFTLMTLDITLGAGFRMSLSHWLALILGVGVHASQISLIPSSAGPDFGTDVAVGAGLLLSLQFPLTAVFLISVELQAAYDFLTIATDPRVDRHLGSGFSTGGAVAFGVIY